MLVIFNPQLLSARTADSRPGPGPPTRTSTFFTPCSCAAVPAFSAATCAANGVLLREPRKPQPPEVAQDSVLPWRSVMVMIVLLKEACTCAIASSTFLRAFFAFFGAAAAAGAAPALPAPCGFGSFCSFCSFCSAISYAFPGGAFSLTACLRGPLRVRALVRVRWPRTGSPRRWRMPRPEPRSISRLMFIETSRRKSPSTANFAICERMAFTSGSVRSFTLVVGLTPAASQERCARARPTPQICVSPTHTCLFIGMLMPAMRAISLSSTLALLVTRVRADDVDHAAAAHDLAVLADLLDRRTYLHVSHPNRCGRSRAGSPS